MRKCNAVAVCCAAVVLLLALSSPASAQPMPMGGDVPSVLLDQWFQLKTIAKGHQISVDDSISNWRERFDAYMYIGGDNESAYYMIVCEVEPGIWTTVTGDFFGGLISDEKLFLSDMYFTFVNPNGRFFYTYVTAFIKSKLDKSGMLKRAKFRTIGSEAFWGIDPTDNSTLHGNSKIKGKTIDPEDLPFDPDNMTEPDQEPEPFIVGLLNY